MVDNCTVHPVTNVTESETRVVLCTRYVKRRQCQDGNRHVLI